MISPVCFFFFFFFFFWHFDFLGCRGGKKAKNGPKWQQKKLKMKNNNYMCHVSYLRNSIAYDQDFLYTCVKWWYLQVFFSSLGCYRGGGSVKGQKMVQNKKKFCLLCFISKESYIIWFSFMVLMFKTIVAPCSFFSSFQNFDFPGC